jgi:hypothetical protein
MVMSATAPPKDPQMRILPPALALFLIAGAASSAFAQQQVTPCTTTDRQGNCISSPPPAYAPAYYYRPPLIRFHVWVGWRGRYYYDPYDPGPIIINIPIGGGHHK